MNDSGKNWDDLTEEDLEEISPGMANALRKHGWTGPDKQPDKQPFLKRLWTVLYGKWGMFLIIAVVFYAIMTWLSYE